MLLPFLREFLPYVLHSPLVCMNLSLVCKEANRLIQLLLTQQPFDCSSLLEAPHPTLPPMPIDRCEIRGFNGRHYLHVVDDSTTIYDLHSQLAIATDPVPAEAESFHLFYPKFMVIDENPICFYYMEGPPRLVAMERLGERRLTFEIPRFCTGVKYFEFDTRRLLQLEYHLDDERESDAYGCQFLDVSAPLGTAWQLVRPVLDDIHWITAVGPWLVLHVYNEDGTITLHTWNVQTNLVPSLTAILSPYPLATTTRHVSSNQLLVRLPDQTCFTYNIDSQRQGAPFAMPDAPCTVSLPRLRIFVINDYHTTLMLYRIVVPSSEMPALLLPLRHVTLSPRLTNPPYVYKMRVVDTDGHYTLYFHLSEFLAPNAPSTDTIVWLGHGPK